MSAPAATGKAIPGATTTYRLESNGSLSVRQGDDSPYTYVTFVDGRPVLGARQLWMYPDGGVWFWAGDFDHYEVGRDNIARHIDWDEHEKRRKAPRGYHPRGYW